MASRSKSSASRSKSTRTRKESPDARELLVLELQEIHSAESQLARVLPRLSKAVEADTLREKIEERLREGEQVLSDVESGLDALEESPGRKKNVAAEGLVNDVREHIQEIEAGPALDAVLIAAIQKTEHYCIAAWGTVKALAKAQGQSEIADAMERALGVGKQYDEELTQLAETEVTPSLLSAFETSDEEDDTEEEDLSTVRRKSSRKGGPERRTN